MASRKSLPSAESYMVALISALPKERAACVLMLDERHNEPQNFQKQPADTNSYTWGRIGDNNVVIASLPAGIYGEVSATQTVSGILYSLNHIRLGLFVGIGAGLPQDTVDEASGVRKVGRDLRVGDVVVSQPDSTSGGVVQYDLGKSKTVNGVELFELKGHLDKPPGALLGALGELQAEHLTGERFIEEHMRVFDTKPILKSYRYPGGHKDTLAEAFKAKFDDPDRLHPTIHYGVIASGNTVVKSSIARDAVVATLKKINIDPLCIEMEAAGVMNTFPCLVIRGICDYANELKNDDWQEHAAGVAAAFAKELLAYVKAGSIHESKTVGELRKIAAGLDRQEKHYQDDKRLAEAEKIIAWLGHYPYAHCNANNATREPVSRLFRESEIYREWLKGCQWQLICQGESGYGLSFHAQGIVSYLLNLYRNNDKIVVLFVFFPAKNTEIVTLLTFIRSLLRQILEPRQQEIPEKIREQWRQARQDGILDQGIGIEDAKASLRILLLQFEQIYLVVNGIEQVEIEQQQDDIRSCLEEMRLSGVTIMVTDRVSQDTVYKTLPKCDECLTEELELYWRCNADGCDYDVCNTCHGDHNPHHEHPVHRLNAYTVQFNVSVEDFEAHIRAELERRLLQQELRSTDTRLRKHQSVLRILRESDRSVWDSTPRLLQEFVEGDYVWAEKILDDIVSQPSISSLRSMLQRLSFDFEISSSKPNDSVCRNLHATLQAQLQKEQTSSLLACKALSLLAAAYDVLRFKQLQHALAMQEGLTNLDSFKNGLIDMDRLHLITGGLLVTEKTEEMDSFPVGYRNKALREYAHKHIDEHFPEAHEMMLSACVQYLQLEPFSQPFETIAELNETLVMYPFASYAACHWGIHAEQVHEKKQELDLDQGIQILHMLRDQARVDCILQIAWHNRSHADLDVSHGLTALHLCAYYGLLGVCELMIDFGITVDEIEPIYNQTALIYASRRGHVDTIDFLLEHGADSDHCSTLGRNALLETILSGHKEAFDELLEAGCDVNAKSADAPAKTALLVAVEEGQHHAVQRLLDHADIEINATDSLGRTALIRAVQYDRPDYVQSLLQHSTISLIHEDLVEKMNALEWTAGHPYSGINDSKAALAMARAIVASSHFSKQEPRVSQIVISRALSAGHDELALLLAYSGSQRELTNDIGHNVFHLAAQYGNRALLEVSHNSSSSHDINQHDKFGATALHLACMNITRKHIEVIEYLLEHSANATIVDDNGMAAHEYAMLESPDLWNECVEALFSKYADVASTRRSVFASALDAFRAIRQQDLALLEDCIATPQFVASKLHSYSGESVLHQIMTLPEEVCNNFLDRLLPTNRLSLNVRNGRGLGVLHPAMLKSSLSSFQRLIEAEGIDLDLRDSSNYSAFELAQRHNEYEKCHLLINKGIKLPASQHIDENVLRTAIIDANVDVVRALIEVGMNTSIRYQQDMWTPLMVTRHNLLEAKERSERPSSSGVEQRDVERRSSLTDILACLEDIHDTTWAKRKKVRMRINIAPLVEHCAQLRKRHIGTVNTMNDLRQLRHKHERLKRRNEQEGRVSSRDVSLFIDHPPSPKPVYPSTTGDSLNSKIIVVMSITIGILAFLWLFRY